MTTDLLGTPRAQGSRPIATPPVLRPSTSAEAGFVYTVCEATVRRVVEASGRQWATARMREKCDADAVDAYTRIVCVDGRDAGFIRVELRPSELWLDSLLLLPPFQRRGVGTGLLAGVQGEAARRQLPIRLGVYFTNPAKAFWEKQGFTTYAEKDYHCFMERAI